MEVRHKPTRELERLYKLQEWFPKQHNNQVIRELNRRYRLRHLGQFKLPAK